MKYQTYKTIADIFMLGTFVLFGTILYDAYAKHVATYDYIAVAISTFTLFTWVFFNNKYRKLYTEYLTKEYRNKYPDNDQFKPPLSLYLMWHGLYSKDNTNTSTLPDQINKEG
jgi:hypothetical protein